MNFALEFTAVLVTGVFNYILGMITTIQHPDYNRTISVPILIMRRWIGAAAAILVVLLVASRYPTGLVWLGLQTGEKNMAAAFGGLFLMVIMLIFMALGQRLAARHKPNPANGPDPNRPDFANVFRYRDRWERLAGMSVLPLEVAAEDLVYRGYLVLLLSRLTGQVVPWVILSMVLSVVIHLYQSRKPRMMLFHAAFALFFISLALLTQNILAPLIAHLYYDLIWMNQTWKSAQGQPGQDTTIVTHSRGSKAAYASFIGMNLLILAGAAVLIFSL